MLSAIWAYYYIFNADLKTSIFSLDFRVTVLEENAGDDGNSSVAELEVRVETLEVKSNDHETRISAAELDINGEQFLFVDYFLLTGYILNIYL